jgi:hypothetical protein
LRSSVANGLHFRNRKTFPIKGTLKLMGVVWHTICTGIPLEYRNTPIDSGDLALSKRVAWVIQLVGVSDQSWCDAAQQTIASLNATLWQSVSCRFDLIAFTAWQ